MSPLQQTSDLKKRIPAALGHKSSHPPSVHDLDRMLAQTARIATLAKKLSAAPGVLRRPQRVPNVESAGPIPFLHLDEFLVRNGAVHIVGWAFVPDWSPADTKAFLRIDAQCAWLAHLPTVLRPDVQATLANHPDIAGRPAAGRLDQSGFHGIIEIAGTSWPESGGSAWLALMNRDQTVANLLPAPAAEGTNG